MDKTTSQFLQRIEDLINFDKRLFYAMLVMIYLLIRYMTNDIILRSIPDYEKLIQDGSLTFFYIFNALHYLWTPFELLWKITLTSFFIWIGSFILGYKLSFRTIWKLVLVADFVFIFPEFIKLLIFATPSDSVTAQAIKDSYPLSLLNIMDTTAIPRRYFYPLKTLNIFEIIYYSILTAGVHIYSKRSLYTSAVIVLFGYLIPLAIWLFFYILVYK